jgi:hypothetical protein
MKKAIRPAADYFLICLAFLVVAELSPFGMIDRFYRFDRHHVFVMSFYTALFVLGLLLRVYQSTSLSRAMCSGAFNGLISGVIAQGVVLSLSVGSILELDNLPELAFSLAVGSAIFLTPVWGALSALAMGLMTSRRPTDRTPYRQI